MTEARARAAPKHLHLGVIHGGRILHEKLVTEQKPIIVGPTQAATLKLPDSAFSGLRVAAKDGFRLFENTGNKYTLAFTEQMSGRITVDNTDVELQTLRVKGLAKRQGDRFYLPLVDKAKGKVVLGDVCVVFNFMEAPPEPKKIELPLSVRSNIVGSWDWTFTGAIAVTTLIFTLFLVHLSTVPVPEEITFDEIEDRFAKMIIPKKIEQEKPAETQTDKPAEKKEEKKEEKKKEEEKPKEDDKEAAAARKKEVQNKVQGKGVLAILGVKGAAKGAVADVFSEGQAINGDIDSAFADINGVGIADGTNHSSRGTGGSGDSASIGSLATAGAGKVGLVEKQEAKVSADVKTETPEVDGALDPQDIARVVKTRMAAIKECYERELKRNPKLAGKVVVRFTIDEEGRVTQASIEENTLGEKAVGACIVSRFERFRFPKPEGGAVPVAYPFIFAPSS
ncbi:MAG: energy transducer TonB [Deltaproteobacteria bacterium]|nr:energy transducer TonB [Deltaproteobacteria bacterium]